MHRLPALPTAALLAVTLVASPPSASADPDAELATAVNAARSASGCAAAQPDPLVQRVAEMANQNTYEYASHRTAAVPFTDPIPALKTVGHPASAAILLSGYGVHYEEARLGMLLQYEAAKPDCSLSQYGAHTWTDDQGASLVAVVLAAP